jgi:hypothetical protein
MIDRRHPLSERERVRDADEQRLAGGPDRLAEDHGGHCCRPAMAVHRTE